MGVTEWVVKLTEYSYFGTLGAFAAVVSHIYNLAKNEVKPTTLLFLSSILAGVYLGVLVGSSIPEDFANRDAIVLLAGASGMKGIEIVISLSKGFLSKFSPK